MFEQTDHEVKMVNRTFLLRLDLLVNWQRSLCTLNSSENLLSKDSYLQVNLIFTDVIHCIKILKSISPSTKLDWFLLVTYVPLFHACLKIWMVFSLTFKEMDELLRKCFSVWVHLMYHFNLSYQVSKVLSIFLNLNSPVGMVPVFMLTAGERAQLYFGQVSLYTWQQF